MIQFDRALQYQFVLFFPEEQQFQVGQPERIGELVSAAHGGPTLGLKLGASQQEQVFSTGTAGPTIALTWRAGSGVWRLTWTSARLDLIFDARGYSEIVEQAVPAIDQAVNRVAQNLANIRRELGVSVNRVALVITGAAAGTTDLRPADIVARTFFNVDVQKNSEAGNVLDISGRVNNTVLWKPAETSAITLNCIDTYAATWGLRDGREETVLTCLFDINTSPKEAIDLSPEEIVSFFTYAQVRINERLSRLLKSE